MLSLVNYGSSDEDNISDEDEQVQTATKPANGVEKEEELTEIKSESTIKLPQPKNIKNDTLEEEEDDEFLHKKEVIEIKPPTAVPKVKQKVQITIPKLSDFDDEDDDKKVNSGPKFPQNRKTGLLNMLPKPAHSFVSIAPKTDIPAVQPKITEPISKIIQKDTEKIATESSTSHQQEVTKKVGLIPYALMDHSKKKEDIKKLKRKPQDSDDSDEEVGSTFFSFDSKLDDLPKVSEDEIKALIAKEANRMEERKKKSEQPEEMEHEQSEYSQYYQQQQEQNKFDQDALKALVGGTKAKRSKVDDIQILEVSENHLVDKEEWLRRNVAGETSFIPTGKIDEKVRLYFFKIRYTIIFITQLSLCFRLFIGSRTCKEETSNFLSGDACREKHG